MNVRIYIRVACEQCCRSISKVICAAAEAGQIGGDGDAAIAAALGDSDFVTEAYALHNHAYIVIAIGTLAENV